MAPAIDPTVTRSLVFAVCLLALFVGHQIGDHVVQTDHQATVKAGTSWPAARAMAGHIINYHVVSALVLISTLRVLGLPLTVGGLLAGLGFSAATHALLDRRWPVLAVLRATRSIKFAQATAPVSGMYVADQALHHAALLVSALLIAVL